MRESDSKIVSRRPVALAPAFAIIIPLFTAILIPASPCMAAGMLTGSATVIDGDTLDVAGERVRLEGIDAPETSQTCGRAWLGTWDCGRAAKRALAKEVAGQTVECAIQGHDKYGRLLGLCSVQGHDINGEMVRSGLAWAFVKYSNSYVDAEAEARTAKAGIWQGEAEPAWVFREKRWASAEQVAPEGCAIKGNVTDKGQIYHLPWSPWYAKVKIDLAKGERWFCSEAEAAAAGWRPAIVN